MDAHQILTDKAVDMLDSGVVPVLLLRELIALPLWLHMACGTSVSWRGKRMKIRSGGLLSIPFEKESIL